jgi:two-component system phosphate regulon sensor histidine kinase PhoR
MDLAQIESGAVELRREKLALSDLLAEARDDFTKMAADRGIGILLRVEGSPIAEADKRRLTQVVHNLVDNAIKFSPDGGEVTLGAAAADGTAVLSVSDAGPGIPRAEQDRIFQRFYQVDRSRSKTRPGTGLGLAIVKHIVQLHGGKVEVQSEVGRGSTFRVILPG